MDHGAPVDRVHLELKKNAFDKVLQQRQLMKWSCPANRGEPTHGSVTGEMTGNNRYK